MPTRDPLSKQMCVNGVEGCGLYAHLFCTASTVVLQFSNQAHDNVKHGSWGRAFHAPRDTYAPRRVAGWLAC